MMRQPSCRGGYRHPTLHPRIRSHIRSSFKNQKNKKLSTHHHAQPIPPTQGTSPFQHSHSISQFQSLKLQNNKIISQGIRELKEFLQDQGVRKKGAHLKNPNPKHHDGRAIIAAPRHIPLPALAFVSHPHQPSQN